MRWMRASSTALVALALALGACSDDDASTNDGPAGMEFVGHEDYGCIATRGDLECQQPATLTRIEAAGDTVSLWIRFLANCCPEFTESVTYDDGVLDIALVDTVYACRCICPFRNEFTFLCEGSGELRLIFESRAGRGAEFCQSGLDTVIMLP